MAHSNPLQGNPDGVRLRREAGAYVKRLRETAGLTQQELAQAIGLPYYTMVSQVESGRTRIPPDRLEGWATAVGADPRAFGQRLLQYYDPWMWQLLFGKIDPKAPQK